MQGRPRYLVMSGNFTRHTVKPLNTQENSSMGIKIYHSKITLTYLYQYNCILKTQEGFKYFIGIVITEYSIIIYQ